MQVHSRTNEVFYFCDLLACYFICSKQYSYMFLDHIMSFLSLELNIQWRRETKLEVYFFF
jgi:hypothetical protein